MFLFVDSWNACDWIWKAYSSKDSEFSAKGNTVKNRNLINEKYYVTVKWNKLSGTGHSDKCRLVDNAWNWALKSPVWNLLNESASQLSQPRTWRTTSWMLNKARSSQSSRRHCCMKRLVEYCELMTETQVELSESSSTLRPSSLRDHNFMAITTVRSSSSLMWRSCERMKSGNSRWKNSPKQIAPQPDRQASVANSSGLEMSTSEGITEMPLYCERKNSHQSRSERSSTVSGKEAFLGREKQARRAFNRRLMNARPGRTQADTKDNLPSNCWSSCRVNEDLCNHLCSSWCNSETRKRGNWQCHVQGVDPNTKAQHMMTGWDIFFGGRHKAKIIKKWVHTLEGLLRTNRGLRTAEVVDVNIDR